MNNTSNAKRFILELVIFSIPASLYGLMSLLLLVSTGEVISLQTAAHIQIDNPAALFGRAYRDDFRAFKYEATRIHDADVLALGSSRVMQFRSPMFPGVDFYNAGGAAANVYELRSFLEQLPADVRPATVIVGLDQDWFHPIHAQRARETDVTIRTMDLINFEGYINLARVAVADFLAGNTILTEVLDGKDPYYENAGIGLQALRHMSGFRSDGSHQYGTTIIDAYELSERREGVLARLYRRGSRFEFGSEVDHGAIAEVESLLIFCKNNSIELVGFLPPYSPTFFMEFESTGRYQYMFDLADTLSVLFSKYEFSFVDATDGGRFGSDEGFVDGFHGGEAIYIRVLQEFYQNHAEAFPETLHVVELASIIEQTLPDALIIFDADNKIVS